MSQFVLLPRHSLPVFGCTGARGQSLGARIAGLADAMFSPYARICLLALAGFLGPTHGTCTAVSDAPHFEVASVKPSPPVDERRAKLMDSLYESSPPGSVPGPEGRVEAHGTTLAQLIAFAHQIRPRTIVGPSWIFETRFDVVATIPSGRSRKEGPAMLRTLLEERFALRAHRDVRIASGYILSVRKDGHKLKQAAPFIPYDARKALNQSLPRLNGDNIWQLGSADMAQLTDVLARLFKAPVEDQTGLKGSYAITIRIAAGDNPDDLERAARIQQALSDLGLRLASGKVQVPILVIDSVSKAPTDN